MFGAGELASAAAAFAPLGERFGLLMRPDRLANLPRCCLMGLFARR